MRPLEPMELAVIVIFALVFLVRSAAVRQPSALSLPTGPTLQCDTAYLAACRHQVRAGRVRPWPTPRAVHLV
jgi:hypothetical protein